MCRRIGSLERGAGRANGKAARGRGEGAVGAGRGGELSAVLNTTGQARGEWSRAGRVLAPTRFLDLSFCPPRQELLSSRPFLKKMKEIKSLPSDKLLFREQEAFKGPRSNRNKALISALGPGL